MKQWSILFFFLAISCSGIAQNNLLLTHSDKNGYPGDHHNLKNGSIKLVDNKLNLSLPAGRSIIYKINITPKIKTLILTGELKAEGIISGKANWQNGRISSRFIKSDGKVLLWVPNDQVSGKSTKKMTRIYQVPKGAHALLVEPANFGTAGILHVSNLAVVNAPANLLASPNIDAIPATGLVKERVKASWVDSKLCISINGNGSLQRNIPVKPHWKAVRLSFKTRYSNVVQGNANWKNARISCRFLDSKYKAVGPWPNNYHFTGTQEKWKTYSRTYSIPKDAAFLRIEPGNFGSSGKVEFNDFAVTIAD